MIGDLFRIYAATLREGASYHWITIPEDFDRRGAEVFDPVKMSVLCDLGYRVAIEGPPWNDKVKPPGVRAWNEGMPVPEESR